MSYPTLDYGDTGNDVKVLQAILQSQGTFNGVVGGNFLSKTLRAVKYFQQTHIDKDGKFLEVDGIVGPKTWWALSNPDGEAQRNHIDGRIPDGLSKERQDILEKALGEHTRGVREIPSGSNWGGRIGSEYLKGIGPAPWCAFFYSWVYNEVMGEYPLKKRHGHCLTFWREAKKVGKAHYKSKYNPIPGDAFIMLYKTRSGQLTGSGHIGIVLSASEGGTAFNTIEGNAGNRVKVGTRYDSQSSLQGFINLHDNNRDFTKKLLSASRMQSSSSSTR